jgi:hypothetical protein
MNYAMKKAKDLKNPHGGKRKGAGRKPGWKKPKSKLKEKTKVRRIPVGILEAVDELIERYKESTSS